MPVPMLITEKFVFIHVPKTGGDFIRRLCSRHMPKEWMVDTETTKHGADLDIPEEYRHLPRFALVRNPWDWHVSWYHYLMGSGRPEHHRDRVKEQNPGFVELTDGFTNDFPTTMRRLYDPDLAQSMTGLARRASSEGVDLLSMRLRRQLGDSLDRDLTTIGKFENLRDEVQGFLSQIGVPLSDRFRFELFERPAVNRSTRARYQDYYDEQLAGLIGARASWITDRWEYSFDDSGDAAHDADPSG
ncbi:sulfotransferase family 2 domain-containing protein [bacterium]|nr:sulfotransferase family 2 domain-containing protein [bacterium]